MKKNNRLYLIITTLISSLLLLPVSVKADLAPIGPEGLPLVDTTTPIILTVGIAIGSVIIVSAVILIIVLLAKNKQGEQPKSGK